MRLPTPTLLPAAASALLALTLAGPVMAAPGEAEPGMAVTETTEQGPVKVVETTDANGDTTKTVTVGGEADPVVKVVEKTEVDGDTTKTVVKVVEGDEGVVKVVETTEVDGDTTKTVVKVVEGDDDDDDDEGEVVEEIVEEEHHHHHRKFKWLGLQASAIFNPGVSNGRVPSSDGRLRQNQFKACVDPAGEHACGYVKGLDLKVQMFKTHGAWTYPRVIGYFRTGFSQGRVHVQPGAEGFAAGDATRLDYTSVPLFFGGNLYLFDEFPVRPYAGFGGGLDILRLDYRRAEQARTVDASARVGFELHGGVEVRISNYISLNAEVMQLWSARRKMAGLPDYSNTGLSVLAGVTIGIPVRLDRRGDDDHHTKTVRKIRRIEHDHD
jgi:hypothetical protein